MLNELLDDDATMWLSGRPLHGRDAIAAELLHSAPRLLSNVDWIVGTGRWEALCSADTDTSAGRRHLTVLLKVVTGNWQIVYLHVG